MVLFVTPKPKRSGQTYKSVNDLSHAPLLPRGIIPRLRDISPLERQALKLVERKANGRIRPGAA